MMPSKVSWCRPMAKDVWEAKIRSPCGLDVSLSLSPLYCDIVLFPESSDKSKIQRIFIAILRHKRLAIL